MPYPSLLRRLRTRNVLSQGELGQLLDLDQTRISRFESDEDLPSLQTMFGLQVIFGHAPKAFLPAVYSVVEEQVMGRAARFERAIAHLKDPATVKKRYLLAGMIHRVRSSADHDGN